MFSEPRHKRVGVSVNPFTLEISPYTAEEKKEFPVVDSDGRIIETIVKYVKCKSSDIMAKYNPDDFSLSAYKHGGIDLHTININRSDSFTIDQLERLCIDIDAREKYVAQVLEQKKERESWLQPVEPENKVESQN